MGQNTRSAKHYNMSGNRVIICGRDATPSALRVALLSLHSSFRGNEPLMRNAWRSGNFFNIHFHILMLRACSSDTEL